MRLHGSLVLSGYPATAVLATYVFFLAVAGTPFLKAFQKRLRDCFSQDWVSHGRVGDRLALYSSFNSSLYQER